MSALTEWELTRKKLGKKKSLAHKAETLPAGTDMIMYGLCVQTFGGTEITITAH